MNLRTENNRREQRGNALLEFAVVSIVIIPLFFGMVSAGINIGRMVEVVQVSRDVGHMYAMGVDFSQTVNRNIAVAITPGLGMAATGGNGIMILSQITQVYQADCDAANLTNSCTNLGQPVFMNRVVIGNSAGVGTVWASRFGTPPSGIVTSSGSISASNYITNGSDVATGFAAILTTAGVTLSDGDVIYLSEAYFGSPDISFLGAQAAQGVYARSIF